MKNRILILASAFFCLGLFSAHAQFDPRDPKFTQWFGENQVCSARIETLNTHTNETGALETSTLSYNISFDHGKYRAETDWSEVNSFGYSNFVAELKSQGHDQTIAIVRPDEKIGYLVYPKLRSYNEIHMTEQDFAAGKDFKEEITELGRETVEGHPCVKNKLVFTDNTGEKHEATVWKATDLNKFTVKFEMHEQGETIIILSKKISLAKPAESQFEPPKEFVRQDNVENKLEQKPTVKRLPNDADSTQIPSLSRFVGEWSNPRPLSPLTSKINRIAIRIETNRIFAHMWGIGNPKKCDLGESEISSTSNNPCLLLNSSRSGSVQSYQLELLDGQLRLTGLSHYTNNNENLVSDIDDKFVRGRYPIQNEILSDASLDEQQKAQKQLLSEIAYLKAVSSQGPLKAMEPPGSVIIFGDSLSGSPALGIGFAFDRKAANTKQVFSCYRSGLQGYEGSCVGSLAITRKGQQFFVEGNDCSAIVTAQMSQQKSVIFMHKSHINDLALDEQDCLYYSEDTGIFKKSQIGDPSAKAELFCAVQKNDVGGYWPGRFAFGRGATGALTTNTLYIASGNCNGHYSIFRLARQNNNWSKPEMIFDTHISIDGLAVTETNECYFVSKNKRQVFRLTDWKKLEQIMSLPDVSLNGITIVPRP